ncbi:MAG: hypothetical protein IPP74_09250 [Alphaproteobacteria bacterium]|nr:hypothetical protein [Alphaproteobacteria bacterium]
MKNRTLIMEEMWEKMQASSDNLFDEYPNLNYQAFAHILYKKCDIIDVVIQKFASDTQLYSREQLSDLKDSIRNHIPALFEFSRVKARNEEIKLACAPDVKNDSLRKHIRIIYRHFDNADKLNRYFIENKIPKSIVQFLNHFNIQDKETLHHRIVDNIYRYLHDSLAESICTLAKIERTKLEGNEILYRGINTSLDEQIIQENLAFTHIPHGRDGNYGWFKFKINTAWLPAERNSIGTSTSFDLDVAIRFALKDRTQENQPRSGWIYEIHPPKYARAVNLADYAFGGIKWQELTFPSLRTQWIYAAYRLSSPDGKQFTFTHKIENPYYSHLLERHTESNLSKMYTLSVKHPDALMQKRTGPLESAKYHIQLGSHLLGMHPRLSAVYCIKHQESDQAFDSLRIKRQNPDCLKRQNPDCLNRPNNTSILRPQFKSHQDFVKKSASSTNVYSQHVPQS